MAGLLKNPGCPIAPLPEGGEAVPADHVAETLRRWASAPFDFAGGNCGLSIVAYAERVTGRTLRPSPRRLGRFGMAAVARRPGRFELVARWAMRRLRCPPTGTPERGDVGLVVLPGSGLTACLCLGGGRWAARGDRRFIVGRGAHVLAWRVSCQRR